MGKKNQNIALIGFGAVALGLLGYIAWKSSKRATTPTILPAYVGGVPVPRLDARLLPPVQQLSPTPVPLPFRWYVPQELADFLAGSQLTLGDDHGFTRVGTDPPAFRLRPGFGFTML